MLTDGHITGHITEVAIFQTFSATKPSIRYQFSLSESAPKLTYSKVEYQKFSEGETPGPRLKGRPRLTRPGSV